MPICVTVSHSDQAWKVRSPALPRALGFASGARAEAEAHAHARQLAAAGREAVVEIYARDARLAGATRYAAQRSA